MEMGRGCKSVIMKSEPEEVSKSSANSFEDMNVNVKLAVTTMKQENPGDYSEMMYDEMIDFEPSGIIVNEEACCEIVIDHGVADLVNDEMTREVRKPAPVVEIDGNLEENDKTDKTHTNNLCHMNQMDDILFKAMDEISKFNPCVNEKRQTDKTSTLILKQELSDESVSDYQKEANVCVSETDSNKSLQREAQTLKKLLSQNDKILSNENICEKGKAEPLPKKTDDDGTCTISTLAGEDKLRAKEDLDMALVKNGQQSSNCDGSHAEAIDKHSTKQDTENTQRKRWRHRHPNFSHPYLPPARYPPPNVQIDPSFKGHHVNPSSNVHISNFLNAKYNHNKLPVNGNSSTRVAVNRFLRPHVDNRTLQNQPARPYISNQPPNNQGGGFSNQYQGPLLAATAPRQVINMGLMNQQGQKSNDYNQACDVPSMPINSSIVSSPDSWNGTRMQHSDFQTSVGSTSNSMGAVNAINGVGPVQTQRLNIQQNQNGARTLQSGLDFHQSLQNFDIDLLNNSMSTSNDPNTRISDSSSVFSYTSFANSNHLNSNIQAPMSGHIDLGNLNAICQNSNDRNRIPGSVNVNNMYRNSGSMRGLKPGSSYAPQNFSRNICDNTQQLHQNPAGIYSTNTGPSNPNPGSKHSYPVHPSGMSSGFSNNAHAISNSSLCSNPNNQQPFPGALTNKFVHSNTSNLHVHRNSENHGIRPVNPSNIYISNNQNSHVNETGQMYQWTR